MRSVLCEGGPTLNSYLLAAGPRGRAVPHAQPEAGRRRRGAHDRGRARAGGAGRARARLARRGRAATCSRAGACAAEPAAETLATVAACRARPLSMAVLMATAQARPAAAPARTRQRAPAADVPVVEFSDVTKVYDGGSVGLDRASMRIGRGEFVFLVGPTGCGKSTCIRLLHEGARADQGRDRDRRPRRSARSRAARVPYLRRNIGVVFQDYKLLPNRTVYDNVAYSLQVIGESAPGDPPQGAGHPAPRRASPPSSTTTPTSCRAASSSASRSRARSSTTRRCCWPTSPPATSTPRPRSGSCS